jgi:hypothetical protein
MRLLIKILAVIVGFFGALIAGGSSLTLIAVASGAAPQRVTPLERGMLISLVVIIATMGVLGYLILRSAWKHLRRPDRSTAQSVLAIATFFLVIRFLRYNQDPPQANAPIDYYAPVWATFFRFAVILGCYLFYRLVLKRLAARAFPASDTPSTSIAAGARPCGP